MQQPLIYAAILMLLLGYRVAIMLKSNRPLLNLGEAVAKIWSRDIPGYMAKADKSWSTLRDK